MLRRFCKAALVIPNTIIKNLEYLQPKVIFLPSVPSVGEVIVESFNLYSALSSYDLHLSSESSRLSKLINHDYSPQCFVITGLNCAVEQFPAKDQCHNYSLFTPSSLGDCSIELLMQLHTGSLSNTRFSAQRLFSAFSTLFLAPSLVTPSSLCQLSEPQN